MTSAQRQRIHRLLLALERQLGGKGPQRIAPNRTDDSQVGGDEDEQPLNEMLQAIASSRNRNTSQVLAKVQKALRKLEEEPEDFGVCEICGEDIVSGRLEAMPYAELCTDCQAKHDGPRGGVRKKLTDYI